MSKQDGTPIYTESAYRAGQVKARGAIVADFLLEIQAAESKVLRFERLYFPNYNFHEKPQDFKDGFLAALQYMRVRFEENHHGATKEAKRLIGKANSQAFALSQCAHFLLELAQESEND